MEKMPGPKPLYHVQPNEDAMVSLTGSWMLGLT